MNFSETDERLSVADRFQYLFSHFQLIGLFIRAQYAPIWELIHVLRNHRRPTHETVRLRLISKPEVLIGLSVSLWHLNFLRHHRVIRIKTKEQFA